MERVKGLDREVDGWHKAQRIRHYIEAVRQWGAERRGGEIKAGSELERWITWGHCSRRTGRGPAGREPSVDLG